MPTDLSANEELGFIKEERSMGLLKSFKEQSIRRGLSGLPSMFTTKEFAQLELTPGGGVVRSGADTDLMYSIHHVGGEDARSGGGSPKLSKGQCSNSTDKDTLLILRNKDSVSGDIAGKEGLQFVSHEGGAVLPPMFKTPEEGVPRRSWGRKGRSPNSRSRSRSRGGDDSLCSTPYSRSSKNSDKRSSSGGKSGGWQYHSSMFSPGDSFWDEAIEAADGLFVSNVKGIPPKQSIVGKSMLSSAERTAHATDGATHNQRAEVAVTGGAMENVGAIVPDTSMEKSPADISVVNLDGMTSTDRNFNQRFDELDVSPLPVRRFSFTCQNSPPSKSIVKSETEIISNISPAEFQLPRDHVGEEPLDVKDILPADQASTGADVDLIGVSTKLRQIQVDTAKAEAVAVILAPIGVDATSTLPEPASRAPSTSPLKSGQICAHFHPSAGDKSEKIKAIVAGAVVSKVEVKEHAFISSSLKNPSLELCDWLPPEACVMYAKKGLKRFYPWQVTLLYYSFNILASVYEVLRSESESLGWAVLSILEMNRTEVF